MKVNRPNLEPCWCRLRMSCCPRSYRPDSTGLPSASTAAEAALTRRDPRPAGGVTARGQRVAGRRGCATRPLQASVRFQLRDEGKSRKDVTLWSTSGRQWLRRAGLNGH